MRTLPSWVLAAILCCSSHALAVITVLEQVGTMTVRGQTGTVTMSAPSTSPWFGVVNSGGGGNVWFAQSFVGTQWTPNRISVYPEAIVSPGAGAPVLTQSFFTLSIRFRIEETANFSIELSAFPRSTHPGIPLENYSIRIVDVATGLAVFEAEVPRRTMVIGAGEYRLEASNNMGNTPSSLSLIAGSRMLSIELSEVPCDSIDFNNDGVSPDSADVTDFLSVFGGGACSNDPNCNDIDFNNDGVSPDSDDIGALLSVFGGGTC